MNRKTKADILFWIQIVLAAFFGFGQAFHMLTESTEGVLVSFFLTWTLFSVLMLYLAVEANKVQSSRVTKQTIIICLSWSLMALLNFITLVYLSGFYWTPTDTWMCFIIISSSFVVVHYWGYKDPISKGALISLFKGIPHLAIGFEILINGGGEGLSWVMMTVGHVTISIRIAQVFMSVKEAGWDRNRKGLILAEIISEVTWIFTTTVWLIALI